MPLRAVGPWPAKPSTAGRSRCAGLNFSGEASLRRFARTGRRQQISVRLRVPDCIEDNTSYPRKVPSRQIQCLHATVSNVRQMAQVCRRIPAYSSTSQAREPAPRTKVCSSQKPFVSRTLGSMGTSPSIKSLRPLKRRQQVAAVCYRVGKSGIEFLLVQTRSGRWIFPKGGVEPGLTGSARSPPRLRLLKRPEFMAGSKKFRSRDIFVEHPTTLFPDQLSRSCPLLLTFAKWRV